MVLALLVLALSVWTSLDGEPNWVGWLVTLGAVINVFAIFGNIGASERQIGAYDARPPA